MKEFIEYAFYGDSYKDLDMETIYNCYVIYCKLFEIDELTKFDFIKKFNECQYK